MKRNRDVDDCLDRIKKSKTLNTKGDLIANLDDCGKILNTKTKQQIISKSDYDEYKEIFNNVFQEKNDEIKTRHEMKGQQYGFNPPHQSTGQRQLYHTLKKKSL